ncbi:MAG: thiamine diphosphokinase [Betaproteobacteria bacterium]
MNETKGKKIGVVVCHGRFRVTPTERDLLRRADAVVAADGGARHAWEAGRQADVVIGDGDSLAETDTLGGEEGLPYLQGCRIVWVPQEKDETDGELALGEAIRLGCQEVVFLGALGGRLDHTLANLQLMAAAAERGIRACAVDGERRVYVLSGRSTRRDDGLSLDRVELSGQPGEYVSLLPMTAVVSGVWTEGLKYPLRGEKLYFGRTRGISNELLEEKARVRLESGVLLVVMPGTLPSRTPREVGGGRAE